MLDPGRGRIKTGQLWAYARDDRPWGGSDPPAVTYVYAPDRTAGRPIAHLAGFEGVLQVDGYAAYEGLAKGGAVRLAYCWSHVRRAFYELAATRRSPPRCWPASRRSTGSRPTSAAARPGSGVPRVRNEAGR